MQNEWLSIPPKVQHTALLAGAGVDTWSDVAAACKACLKITKRQPNVDSLAAVRQGAVLLKRGASIVTNSLSVT